MKFIEKIKYKQELKSLTAKLSFLLEEARKGKSTKADLKFWNIYLDRLKKINETGLIKNSEQVYNYYLTHYNKYINKFNNQ